MTDLPILEARDVYKFYPLQRKQLLGRPPVVEAVRGISFSLYAGETLGCVGESGCGKSTLSRLLILLEGPTKGEVRYGRKNIHRLTREEKKKIRGRVQLVLQDPYLSLPAWMKVGDIIEDALKIHEGRTTTRRQKHERVFKVLAEVGLGKEAYDRYPYSFSAGQRQMINIARAIILNPEIVILDEAVSALDVSVQAKILNLFADLRARRNLSYLLISHDIGVVRHMCDRIGVMYLGRMVEIGLNADIFANPLHPYTRALLEAVPTIETGLENRKAEVLAGEVPSPIRIPPGCSFKSRCPRAMPVCGEQSPGRNVVGDNHYVECHLYN